MKRNKKHKWKYRINIKKKVIVLVILGVSLFVGLGYAILGTNLEILGTLEVAKNDRTLYNVIKNGVKTGHAIKYTDSHQDSMDLSKSTKDIYYYSGTNDIKGAEILDKNNVILAGHCWQMIRTTDTGGVKMIYNGEVEDGKCLSNRGVHVGYAGRSSQRLTSNYWYGTDYTYDSVTNKFKISGDKEQATWSESTGPSLIGKYTCMNVNVDGTCSTLYLVESYADSSNAYVILLNSNSDYSQFGTLQFNADYNSPSYVGYMYNAVYPYDTKPMANTETVLSRAYLSTDYWYANSVTWGNPTADRYILNNPYQVSATDYPSLVGEYTFRSIWDTSTDTNVYYIAAVDNRTMFYLLLSDTDNHTLSDVNYTYTYGDSYRDNGNGTYTINSPTTIERKDWYTNYENVRNKYVCKNAVNDTCSDLWYITETSILDITYISVLNNYKYSNGFSWDGSKYILNNTNSNTFFEWNDTNRTSINNAHYTCWNTTGECSTISYIYYIRGTTPYYINITDGKNVNDVLKEMLYSDNLNVKNSTIKNGIDAWYKHYMLGNYDDYIEDTIFCNDRSIYSLGGWNANGGNTNSYIQFYEDAKKYNLSCTNTTDKFSVSNNSAKLTYKVGLMSLPEMIFERNIRYTGNRYWLISSFDFADVVARDYAVDNYGGLPYANIHNMHGVRPAISLIPGIEYSSGDGSKANPYIIKPHDGWFLTNSLTPLLEQKSEYWLDGEKIMNGWRYDLEDLSGRPNSYYFKDGYAYHGWLEIDGKKYYLSEFDDDQNGYIDGRRFNGETREIDGVSYTFDNDGVCTNCD